MDKDKIIKRFKEKGYKNIFVWSDSKGIYYDWHSHPYNEIRYILKGKMKINTKDKSIILNPGEIAEVKAKELHEAYVLEDCEYICAQKP